MINPFFTTKFLQVFSLATVLTLGFAHQGFAAAAYDDEDEETPQTSLKPIEDSAIALFLSTSKPEVYSKCIRHMKKFHWNVTTSSQIDYAIHSSTDVIVTIHSTGVDFKAEPQDSIPLKRLYRYLGVEKDLYGAFLRKYGLMKHLEKLVMPTILGDAYASIDSHCIKRLANIYGDSSRNQWVVAGGPIASLIAISIKVYQPELPLRLVIFRPITSDMGRFLGSIGVDFIAGRRGADYPSILKPFL